MKPSKPKKTPHKGQPSPTVLGHFENENMTQIDNLNSFAENVQYASNWRESMAELAQTLRAGLEEQAAAIAALEAAAAAPAAAPAEAAPAEAAPA